MFTTGQKVVCVNGEFPDWIKKLYRELPVKDVVYVVRGTTVGVGYGSNGREDEGEICVYLVGLNNPTSNKPPYRERGFKWDRFRPLETTTETNAESQPESVPVRREELVPA
jgi:hypothetical protein